MDEEEPLERAKHAEALGHVGSRKSYCGTEELAEHFSELLRLEKSFTSSLHHSAAARTSLFHLGAEASQVGV